MTYDFVIVGGGPGGYTAALRAASLGKSVALVEAENLGGVCLNWGCIPTKALLKCSKLYEQMQKASAYGISCSGVSVDLAQVIGRKDKVVAQLRTGLAKLMEQRKIEVFQGKGLLKDPKTVLVESKEGKTELKAENIILATGASVADLPGLAADGKDIYNIRAALDLTDLPKRLAIVGAGVVGCEMAQFFSGLGCQVSLVDILPGPIGGLLDMDLEKLVLRGFKKRKYQTFFGQGFSSVEKADGGLKLTLDSGKAIEADKILVAVGMKPNSRGLGLEAAGIEANQRGHVVVDDHCLTTLPGVYAVGDVTGIMPLAHFAAHMGLVAVHHALGRGHAEIDRDAVPMAVFTDPELAWVGLDEKKARERFGDCITGQFMVRGLGRATAEGALDGVVKLVARPDDQVVVGVHIMGPEASSLVAEAALAVAKGLTVSDLAETIHAHPTYAEGIAEAAETALGLPIH